MINYDNKEIEYLKNICNSVLFPTMANEDFIDYINELDAEGIEDCKYLMDNIDKINDDIDINNLTLRICNSILCFWYWIDLQYNAKELYEFMDDCEFTTIYEKYLNEINKN